MHKDRLLIIGYGNIGQRHASIAESMGLKVGWVTSRKDAPSNSWKDVSHGITNWDPQWIIVANATESHAASLGALSTLKFKGKVLVEKPLSANSGELLPELAKMEISVGYNLRFLKMVELLKAVCTSEAVLSADFVCSTYLPDWNPKRPFLESYRGSKKGGGGALRDVSHEIDLALLLLGRPKRITAYGGTLSKLGITADDCYVCLAEGRRSEILTIRLDLFGLVPTRKITIKTDTATFEADLLKGSLFKNGERIIDNDLVSDTYKEQLSSWLSGDRGKIASFMDGKRTLDFIEAAERCTTEGVWTHFGEG